MKIFIYNLEELEGLMDYFHNPPSEMNLYELYKSQLKKKFEVVQNIDDCDLAFIPIDFTKLFFGQVKENKWTELYSLLLDKTGIEDSVPTSQPPTIGVDYKEDYLKFFWSNYVESFLNLSSGKPHFLLYSYVLFEISFEPIPREIFILSYEKEVSIHNTVQTLRLGTHNRVIPIPYILNSNESYFLDRIDSFKNETKEYDISFIGSIEDKDRPLLTKFRNFLRFFGKRIHRTDTSNIQETISKSKYNMVLRGDTPTRMSFYQCFTYNTVPIIFESEIKIYKELSTDEFSIVDSCLVLPNKNDMGDKEYYKIIEGILFQELLDEKNYLDKVKNHKIIFDNLNYFSDECLPIRNSLRKVISLS
jgi:hypothetical protein